MIARTDLIARKVDEDLNDDERYTKLDNDDTKDILDKIEFWWHNEKVNLSVLKEDILEWLVNPESKPGKMKTHKPNLPVREVFSVCAQSVENLSAFIQHA